MDASESSRWFLMEMQRIKNYDPRGISICTSLTWFVTGKERKRRTLACSKLPAQMLTGASACSVTGWKLRGIRHGKSQRPGG